jgi:hypothetical protein
VTYFEQNAALMKVLKCLGILLLLFSFVGASYGQKKVLGYPQAFNELTDPFAEGRYEQLIQQAGLKKKSAFIPWMVTIDRNGVRAYDKPNGNQIGLLGFGKQFYVMDEREDWLQLTDEKVECKGLQLSTNCYGWVKKQDLLLWNECLLNTSTKSFLEVLLVGEPQYPVDLCSSNELAPVFNSPSGKELKADCYFEKAYYFVYKKEAGYYLLGKRPNINYKDSTVLLGWVNGNRLLEWNTRLGLEPNFEQDAFQERKNNPKFRVAGFKQFRDAEAYCDGLISIERAEYHLDPVFAPMQELSKNDPKRYSETRMPFPVFALNTNGSSCYQTAVCYAVGQLARCPETGKTGVKKITVEKHAQITQRLHEMAVKSKSFNVVFVVEGNSEMALLKPALNTALDEIKSKIQSEAPDAEVKFGALIYKDVKGANADLKGRDLIELIGLKNDEKAVKEWINRADFSSSNGTGNSPALYFGLREAIHRVGFEKNATNIVIVVGLHGNYSYDPEIKRAYGGKAFEVNLMDLSALISTNNINLISIQCRNKNDHATQFFSRQMYRIPFEMAKYRYEIQYAKELPGVRRVFERLSYKPSVPEMEDPEEDNSAWTTLENSALFAGIYRMRGDSGVILPQHFNAVLNNAVGEITKKAVHFDAELSQWDFEKINRSGFDAQLAEVLAQLCKEFGLDENFAEEKVQLFTPIYFCRQPQGAKYPTFSFVSFWNEYELSRWESFTRRAFSIIDQGYPEKRKILHDLLCDILSDLGGNPKEKPCGEYKISEIMGRLLGVGGAGIDMGQTCFPDIKVRCILDSRCLSDEALDELIRCMGKYEKSLKKYKRCYISGDFSFNRGAGKYYWVKLSDMF